MAYVTNERLFHVDIRENGGRVPPFMISAVDKVFF
jgi:hypothetical protein